MALQHLRASTANKRPTPAAMADGQLAMNTNLASPGLFFKDSNGDLVKAGPVHVGTTAPNVSPASGGQTGNSTGEQWLDTSGSPVLKIWDGSSWRSQSGEFPLGAVGTPSITFTGDLDTGLWSPAADTIAASTNGSERARIDSSGRLLVGTSTAPTFNATTAPLNIAFGNTHAASFMRYSANEFGPFLGIGKSRSGTIGSQTAVQQNDGLGTIAFLGSNGTDLSNTSASISCFVDEEPFTAGDTTDLPGRLVFSTTADGASSPTERMRITSTGDVLINNATFGGLNSVCFASNSATDRAQIYVANNEATDGSAPLIVNRSASDGRLVHLRQANTTEGTISVSGTTVTYGGGHLARWSQLLNDEDPSGILKGTVMSNLDEMCEWGEEDNEQLNKTKVSDVEGDPNVAGVFVSTSFDEDGPLDFFVAMTGDMIIRIAEGVTVQRGDLLMSAGDGTAKPQDDDIIRSKTIAKVTSTHVTCTYDDGSYCVPCVLMAC